MGSSIRNVINASISYSYNSKQTIQYRKSTCPVSDAKKTRHDFYQIQIKYEIELDSDISVVTVGLSCLTVAQQRMSWQQTGRGIFS